MAGFLNLKTLTFYNVLLLLLVIFVLLHILGYFDVFVVKEGMSKNQDKTLMVMLWIFIAAFGYFYANVVLGPLFGIGIKRVPITDEQWKFP
jgi:hypothetical protein